MKTNVIIKAAIASAFGLTLAGSAFAASDLDLTGTASTNFALEAFPAADTVVAGSIVVTSGAALALNDLNGATISLTLDKGTWSPTSLPVINAGAKAAGHTLSSPTLSNNNKTLSVTVSGVGTATAAGTFLTVVTPVITGVGATLADYSTPGTTNRVRVSVTISGGVAASATVGAGAATPSNLALSTPVYSQTTAATTPNVDIQNDGKAQVFRNTANTANIKYADFGTLTLNAPAAAQEINNGVTAFSASANESGQITLTSAAFPSLSSVYLIDSASQCSETVPAALSATPTSTSVKLSGVAIPTVAKTYRVCGVVSGNALIDLSGTSAKVYSVFAINWASRTVGTTTYTPSGYTYANPLNAASAAQGANSALTSTVSYNGTVAGEQTYVFGTGGGYTSYLRVGSKVSTPSKIFISVRKDDGTNYFGTLDAALGAYAAKLYSVSDINTALGSTVLGDASARSRVTILSTSPVAPTASTLLVNPSGAVNNIW